MGERARELITDELIKQLGRDLQNQTPAATDRQPSKPVSSADTAATYGPNALKEDPAMSCFRRTWATVRDEHGVVHTETLYVQLGNALGIDFAKIQPCATNVCSANAYDCGGVFYDTKGQPIRVPPFPASAQTDAAVDSWRDSVTAFYQGAYTDTKGQKLSPGKAALCETWAHVYFATNPDTSVLGAMTELQQMGAEKMVGQDFGWITNILSAGEKSGCATPASLADHRIDGWWIPMEHARAFHAGFRNCAEPDVNNVGGCPHSFDAPKGPGNHVNDKYILDAENSKQNVRATAFIGD